MKTLPVTLLTLLALSLPASAQSSPDTLDQGMVSFIFDDGFVQDATVMLPMFQKRGLVAASAIITSDLDRPRPTHLTLAQVKGLAAAGWEIMSHTVTHPWMTEQDEATVWREMRESVTRLQQAGLKVSTFAYPYGDHNAFTRQVASQVFQAAFISDAGLNDARSDRLALRRIPLGSHLKEGQDTLAYYKAQVDKAVAEKAWAVFVLHSSPLVQSPEQLAIIGQVLDYVRDRRVKVVTPSQGVAVLNAKAPGLAPSALKPADVRVVAQASYSNDSVAAAFPVGVTYMVVGGGDRGGFPLDAGTLQTTRLNPDPGFTHQVLYGYQSARVLQRHWLSSGWSPWTEVVQGGRPVTATKHLLTFRELAPGAFEQHDLELPGVLYGDSVVATPLYGLQGGLVWNVWSQPGKVTVRVTNVSAQPVTPQAQEWVVQVTPSLLK